MGFSFLSHLPTPLGTIEQILNKSRPTMSEEALKEHLMRRDSVTDIQSQTTKAGDQSGITNILESLQ